MTVIKPPTVSPERVTVTAARGPSATEGVEKTPVVISLYFMLVVVPSTRVKVQELEGEAAEEGVVKVIPKDITAPVLQVGLQNPEIVINYPVPLATTESMVPPEVTEVGVPVA